jgi:hypothetical protein
MLLTSGITHGSLIGDLLRQAKLPVTSVINRKVATHFGRNGLSRSVTPEHADFPDGLREAGAGSVALRPQQNLSSGLVSALVQRVNVGVG